MEFVQAIRQRRERTVQRALAMLEMYGTADAHSKTALLQVAAKGLADVRVLLRWIDVLSNESDPQMRQELLRLLAPLDFRQVPPESNCVAQLLRCLDEPDAREWALYCLARIAPRDPSLVGPLIASYKAQTDATVANRIIAVLFCIGDISDELALFFVSVLDEVDITFKLALVHKLLERDVLPVQVLEKLLAPTEPAMIKVQTLDHMIDRSIRLDNLTVNLLRDPDPSCRYAAVFALTETGDPHSEVLEALLDAATNDPDDHVRQYAISAFEHTLAKTPEVITGLIEALRREHSAPRAGLILKLLQPHLQRNSQVVTALTSLLENNLQTDIALEVYAALGALAPWNAALMDWLIAACTREKEDRLKAAILKPLAQVNAADSRVTGLCIDAIKMNDPEIQQWGVQGLLLLPGTPENLPALTAGATLLLSPDISSDLLEGLAHKLAIIPGKPPELLARLKTAAEQSRNDALRKVCEDACNKILSDATSPDDSGVDWDGWIHRAEIEHRANGIFPAMYEHFDESPEKARRVLKALLNPQCSESLYSTYGYDVSESSILELLDRKNSIDDDVSRLLVGRTLIQTAGTPDVYLQYLTSNPAYPQLRESAWKIVGMRADASPSLLRTLLIVAYGDEEAAAAAFLERIAALPTADSLRPYVRLLTENLGWEPAHELLKAVFKHKALKGDLLATVRSALLRLGPPEPETSAPAAEPPQKTGPGFADD